MCDLNMDVFVPTPGVVCWAKTSLQLYAKHGGTNEEVAHFKMQGTTFSGHPTLTTLGNTLRTIMYTKFAAFMSGIEMVCMVAGDDCAAFVHRDDAIPLRVAFETFIASPDKLAKTHGLGQVISSYFIREWWNIDFCSKFAIHAEGGKGFEGLYLLRDPVKFIETKHFYNGKNVVLRWSAHLHAEAMLECAKVEMPIPALLDYLHIRLAKYRMHHESEAHLDTLKYFESVQKQHRLWSNKILPTHIDAVEQRVL